MKKIINPIIIRLFTFLLFIAISSAAYLLLPDQIQTPIITDKQKKIETAIDQTNIPPIIPSSTIGEAPPKTQIITPNTSATSPSTITDIQPNSTTTPIETAFEIATLLINESEYQIKFKTSETLLTAMQRLDQADSTFSFSGVEYSQIGYFLNEINGQKNNAEYFWIYYINDKEAPIGISNYILKHSDKITWKYEKNRY